MLAGGGCRVPRLREMLSKVFPNSELLGSVPADHVVTLGAAMQAALMEEYNAKLPPSLPSSLPCTSQDIYVVVSEAWFIIIYDTSTSIVSQVSL